MPTSTGCATSHAKKGREGRHTAHNKRGSRNSRNYSSTSSRTSSRNSRVVGIRKSTKKDKMNCPPYSQYVLNTSVAAPTKVTLHDIVNAVLEDDEA